MATLIANDCVNCRRILGFVTEKALQIPTLCIICAADPEVMNEWGHRLRKSEKLIEALIDYRSTLNRLPVLRPPDMQQP